MEDSGVRSRRKKAACSEPREFKRTAVKMTGGRSVVPALEER